MDKKKTLVIVLGILIIIAIILGIIFVIEKNKVDIILNAGKNMMELNSSKEQNVYIKSVYNNGYYEEYKLNNSVKYIEYNKENRTQYTYISTPTKVISYLQSDDGTIKVMSIALFEDNNDNTDEIPYNKDNYSYKYDFFETIFAGMGIKISSEVVDGKDCYVIKNNAINSLSDGSTQYIDKKTNLPVKVIDKQGKEIVTYEYNFGVVNKDDLAELDTTGFTLISKEEFENYQSGN